MTKPSRRMFLVGPAVVAAPLLPALAEPQVEQKRNLLAKLWPEGRAAAALLPRDRFHPHPTSSERSPWEGLPPDARTALVQNAEKQLAAPWEVLPATMALEFARNGNRSRYEDLRNRRRRKLQDLVIGECIENKGRFADEIANGVWLTCEESFWGVPAHLGAQKAGVGLPDVAEPIVDLFAAETAALLAWTAYLVTPQLTAVSKLIPERIRLETDRRLLTPCLAREFSWMGYNGRPVNNWNPWICSNWLTAALLVETSETRRAAAVQRILQCLDFFLNGYADDGGCDEGPGYWGRAGASLFDCLDLLHSASGGKLDAFGQPLVHEIGLYICRAHISGDWYTNFADAAARVDIAGDLVYRYGKQTGDQAMMAHGAYAAFLRNPAGLPGDSIGRQLPGLFNLAELRKAPRAQALIRDTWLPGVQVMAARLQAGSDRGLYLAAQGGHNAESHNHNDVGNFLIYSNGMPAIIDVGVETYTAKTFSSRRYEIWTMQSAYHNLPTVNGVMQSAGREFQAAGVEYQSSDASVRFQLDISHAYPKEAGIRSWNRTLRLDRTKNEIECADEYRMESAPKEITLTLMTCCAVTPSPGVLSLAVASGNTVKVAFDARAFSPSVEEIRLEDARLRRSWGERIFRVQLKATNPGAQANWNLRFSQA